MHEAHSAFVPWPRLQAPARTLDVAYKAAKIARVVIELVDGAANYREKLRPSVSAR